MTDRMNFEIKDSGERLLFGSGMQRDTNEDKPRFDLLFPLLQNFDDQIIVRFAKHMGNGAKKYSERNWELAESSDELNRFMESAIRHFIQWYLGMTDEDHAVATWFNMMGAEYVKSRTSSD